LYLHNTRVIIKAISREMAGTGWISRNEGNWCPDYRIELKDAIAKLAGTGSSVLSRTDIKPADMMRSLFLPTGFALHHSLPEDKSPGLYRSQRRIFSFVLKPKRILIPFLPGYNQYSGKHMGDPITVEIIGFSGAECGPFPCEPDRTCGLEECFPTGSFMKAVEALRHALAGRYGGRVQVTLTLLDDGVPDRVKAIIERSHPPIPIVLVAGRVTPIGRVSCPKIIKEIDKVLTA
jgi:hypothetical protein